MAHLGSIDSYVENSEAKHVADSKWNLMKLPEQMADYHVAFVKQ